MPDRTKAQPSALGGPALAGSLKADPEAEAVERFGLVLASLRKRCTAAMTAGRVELHVNVEDMDVVLRLAVPCLDALRDKYGVRHG